MTLNQYAANLSAFSLQVALLLLAGLLLPALLRLREPDLRLRIWQGLLGAALLLPLLQPWRVPQEGLAGVVRLESWTAKALPTATEAFAGPSPWEVLFWVLGAGLILRLLWLGTGLVALAVLRRRARPLHPLPAAVERIRERLGVRASFRVCRRVAGPVTYGWRNPVILVPPAFLSLPEASQEGVACHELLHVRRRDWLFVLFEAFASTLLWFHPVVWLLVRRIGLSREQAVDREVVRITGRKRAYMETLCRLACPIHERAAFPALFFFNHSHLLQRMAHLSREMPMSRTRLAITALVLSGLLALTGALGAGAFPLVTSGDRSASTSGLTTGDTAVTRPEMILDTAPAESKDEDPKPELQPKILKKTPPTYPDEAKGKKIEGVVVVEAVIGREGKVLDARIVKSDHELFNQPTLDAIRRWEFEPLDLPEGTPSIAYTFTVKYQLS